MSAIPTPPPGYATWLDWFDDPSVRFKSNVRPDVAAQNAARELDALSEKATAAPWESDTVDISTKQPYKCLFAMLGDGDEQDTLNAAFVARLRNAWPHISQALREMAEKYREAAKFRDALRARHAIRADPHDPGHKTPCPDDPNEIIDDLVDAAEQFMFIPLSKEIDKLRAEREALRKRIEDAPVRYMQRCMFGADCGVLNVWESTHPSVANIRVRIVEDPEPNAQEAT